MIKALKGAFGFLTILPVGMPDSLEDVARKMYLFPIVGAAVGLAAGLFIHLFSTIFPPSVSGALGYFVLLSLTGLHHLDGLLDFGDALIFRGAAEKRISIMRDTNVGAGGFAAGLFVTLLGVFATIEFISAGGTAVVFFIASETFAKLAMVLGAAFGRAAAQGTGSIFVEAVRAHRRQALASTLLAVMLIWPFIGAGSLVLLIVTFVPALVFVWASNRLSIGMTGDVFGAVNETTRMIVMLVILWML